MRQKKGTFFKICHFLITGRVVLHKKFYKKNFIYQLSKMENYLQKSKKLLFGGWIYYSRGEKKWTFFRLISIEKVKNYLLIQKDNSLTFYATKKKGTFFKICHFLITGRVVLHKKFYKKISSTSYQKWKIFSKKNFFLVAGFIILGVKKNEHFSIDFNRKSEELSFNSKDNSLTFYATKEGNVFSKSVTFW